MGGITLLLWFVMEQSERDRIVGGHSIDVVQPKERPTGAHTQPQSEVLHACATNAMLNGQASGAYPPTSSLQWVNRKQI